MIKKLIPILTSFILVACVPATPQSRIAKFPDKFAKLNKKEQSLVQQGQIAAGMPRDAVMLAWGFPSRCLEGSQNSKITERWDYSTDVPVYNFGYPYGAYGYGRVRYGPNYPNYPDFGLNMTPEIAYIPSRVASVWFIEQRVDAWERVR
jgi:hypothetical protein